MDLAFALSNKFPIFSNFDFLFFLSEKKLFLDLKDKKSFCKGLSDRQRPFFNLTNPFFRLSHFFVSLHHFVAGISAQVTLFYWHGAASFYMTTFCLKTFNFLKLWCICIWIDIMTLCC
jgi:hypothetical protein